MEGVRGSFRKNNRTRQEEAEIQTLICRHKKLSKYIESCTSKDLKKEWKKERNKILNEMKCKLVFLNDNRLEKELENVEPKHTDASKCYEAARTL